ncbi:exported hypothetical protein [Cupriavidus taiwanensis]|nr:exported hypothetical protein [Cupriavidus taiwanensis]
MARSASLRSHALTRASLLVFIARLFAPLSRARERGGGEGGRLDEVGPMHGGGPGNLPLPHQRLCLRYAQTPKDRQPISSLRSSRRRPRDIARSRLPTPCWDRSIVGDRRHRP